MSTAEALGVPPIVARMSTLLLASLVTTTWGCGSSDSSEDANDSSSTADANAARAGAAAGGNTHESSAGASSTVGNASVSEGGSDTASGAGDSSTDDGSAGDDAAGGTATSNASSGDQETTTDGGANGGRAGAGTDDTTASSGGANSGGGDDAAAAAGSESTGADDGSPTSNDLPACSSEVSISFAGDDSEFTCFTPWEASSVTLELVESGHPGCGGGECADTDVSADRFWLTPAELLLDLSSLACAIQSVEVDLLDFAGDSFIVLYSGSEVVAEQEWLEFERAVVELEVPTGKTVTHVGIQGCELAVYSITLK